MEPKTFPWMRTAIVAALAATAIGGAAMVAMADDRRADDDEGQRWRMHRWMDRDEDSAPRDMCNRFVDMRAGFLAGTESRLRLTAAQQPAWDAFAAAATANRDQVIAFCATLPEKAGDLTAPERLDRMTEGAKLMVAMLDGANGPFKALYAQLTQDQQKILDDFPMGPHHRRH